MGDERCSHVNTGSMFLVEVAAFAYLFLSGQSKFWRFCMALGSNTVKGRVRKSI